MSRIRIAFDQGSQHAFGTPIPVWVLNDHLERIDDRVISLSFPETVEVPGPGLYHIRAALPTGERLKASVRLPEATEQVDAVLGTAEGSPRETLAWAYAQQGIRQATQITRDYAPPDEAAIEPLPPPPLVDITGVFRIASAAPKGFPFWPLIPASVSCKEDETVAAVDRRLVKIVRLDQLDVQLTDSSGWYPVYVRRRARLQDGDAEDDGFVAIPGVPLHRSTTLLFVRSDRDARTESAVSGLVETWPPGPGALLGYLMKGDFDAARLVAEGVVKDAVNILREKKENPFGAAIAGYFLVRAGWQEQPDWLKNLADWFPEIPDGAVLHAADLLRSENCGPLEQEEARHYLLESVRRGLPAYTVGLRMLFDSLRRISNICSKNKGDAELETALAKVRAVTAFANWETPTTSICLPSGMSPSAVRISL